MSVYPEKRSGRQEARAACGAQFWEQEAQSARSLEGSCQTLPCEPPPLQLCAHHGLNRTQQLIAAQALFLPAVPGYDASDGGAVLDRVMIRKGGKAWWANLACRARAQKIVKRHRAGEPVGQVLRDLDNYSVNARLRSSVGRRCSINALLEVPNINDAQKAIKEHGWVQTWELQSPEPIYQGQATIKLHLPGHELKGMATKNKQYLDSAATYSRVNLASSLDLASNPRGDGIHYRVGFHQVTAPKEEIANSTQQDLALSKGDLDSSLHFQGAVAVEGEATLWRPSSDKNAWPQPRRDTPGPFDDEDEDSEDSESVKPEHELNDKPGQTSNPAEDVLEPLSADEDYLPEARQNPDLEPSEASDEDQEMPDTEYSNKAMQRYTSSQLVPNTPTSEHTQEDWMPIDWRPGNGLRGGWNDFADSPDREALGEASKGWKQTDEEISQAGNKDSTRKPVGFTSLPTNRLGVLPFKSSAFTKHKPKSQFEEIRKMMGTGPVLEGVKASEIQQGMQSSKSAIDSMRRSLNSLTSQVRLSMQNNAASPTRNPNKAVRRPYSVLLAEPFIKVNGAIGCLARMPMPSEAFRLNQLPANGESSEKNGNLSSRWSQELWTPYLRDTALRVFASCGLSAQAGRFSKKFADFTAASLRLDLGLTSPDSTPGLPILTDQSEKDQDLSPRKQPSLGHHCRHRAFALEGRGIWHAASLSLTQQIFGPLRGRVDSRVALDLTSQDRTDSKLGLSFRDIAASAPWVQPVFLETVWGLDLVIPGSKGAARACAWYSPVRKEGMIEMRIC